MLYLVCKYAHVVGQPTPLDSKLEIDLTNRTANDESAVYPATISATSIYYKIEFNETGHRQLHEFRVDRVKGTLTWSVENHFPNVTIPYATYIGHCTSSKTPPPTKF